MAKKKKKKKRPAAENAETNASETEKPWARELYLAVGNQDLESLGLLVEHGANVNVDWNGKPLVMAALDSPKVFEALIAHGLDPLALNEHWMSGFASADPEIVKLAVGFYDFKGTGHARWAHNPEVARMMLEAGADPDALSHNQTKVEMLTNAAIGKKRKELAEDLEMLRVFLEFGADPNRVDTYGSTPLLKAAARGWFNGFSLLLEFGADPAVEDENGRTVRDFFEFFKTKKDLKAAEKLVAEAESR